MNDHIGYVAGLLDNGYASTEEIHDFLIKDGLSEAEAFYTFHNCGICIHAYNDGTGTPGKGSLGEDLPRHFTDEEWQVWNAEYRSKK